MQLLGRSGRQGPWWFAIGLFVCLYVFNIVAAAPLTDATTDGATVLDERVQRASSSLNKRDGWIKHPSISYHGEGFAMHTDPSGSKLLFHHYLPYDDIAVVPRQIHEFTKAQQKQIFRAIPAIKDVNTRDYSWFQPTIRARVGRHFNDPAGIYTLPERKGHTVDVRSKNGRFEFNYLGKNMFGSDKRKWATYQELPEHMQKFLVKYAQSYPDVPWRSVLSRIRKRSMPLDERDVHGTVRSPAELHKRDGWTKHPSLAYKGEGFVVHQNPHGQILFNHFLPYDGFAVVPKPINEWRPEERKQIFKVIPGLKELQTNGWRWDKLKRMPTVGRHLYDPAGVYTFPDRKEHTVQVRSKGGRFEFNYLGKNMLGSDTRKWATYDDLPIHMQKFLSRYVESDPSVPWREVVRRLRKRSDIELHKRAKSEFVASYTYPGEKIVITRPGHDAQTPYRLHFLSEDGQRVLRTRKWSDLSQEFRTRLSHRVPNIGTVMSSNLPANEAERWNIKLGTDPFDEAKAYVHPEYHAENVQILRKGPGRLVFSRSGQAPVKFAELPDHLRSFLHRQTGFQDLLNEATSPESSSSLKRLSKFFKRSLDKRAPPKPLSDTPLHMIPYRGERITLTKARDGTYLFNFMSLRRDGLPDRIYRYASWNQLPESIKNHFRNIPGVPTVAKSTLSVDFARGMPVMVADSSHDLHQSYVHPERLAETLRVYPTDRGIMFQRQTARRVHALVPLGELPEHLQSYLHSQPELTNVLSWARRGGR